MTFVIQQLDWYKRRKPELMPKPVSVEVPDFRKEINHFCEIQVVFDTGDIVTMKGRVTQNPITGIWSVHGINSQGQSISARYVED